MSFLKIEVKKNKTDVGCVNKVSRKKLKGNEVVYKLYRNSINDVKSFKKKCMNLAQRGKY